MSTAALPTPQVRPGDRLSLTVFFAVVLHALVIMGVSFSLPDENAQERLPGLEVTLVQTRTDKKIEDADFLAQASQEGGGETEEKARPSTSSPSPVPDNQQGESAEFVPETIIPQTRQPQQREILTAERGQFEIGSVPSPSDIVTDETVTSAQLVQRSKEIARLSAQLDQETRAFASKPRRKIITAATKEYQYAAYEEGWRAKVERIGTINFPDEARRRKLSGSLIMSVSIRPNGSVAEVKITKSSGQRVLDDAAIRIVRLAAPFAPLPPEMLAEIDELVILRTWIFEADRGTFTQK